MPEGPVIARLRDSLYKFKNKKITEASGYAKIPLKKFHGKKITGFDTHGKELFILVDDAPIIRVHLMLFGTYRIDDHKEGKNPIVHLGMENGEINFYVCNIKVIEGKLSDYADPATDVMSKKWDPKLALENVKEKSDELIADVLFDQSIFAGIGNKTKNEVLYMAGIHPESLVKFIPDKKLKELIGIIPDFADMFYKLAAKPETMNEHWQVYDKDQGPKGEAIVKKKVGKTKRTSYIVEMRQKLYVR